MPAPGPGDAWTAPRPVAEAEGTPGRLLFVSHHFPPDATIGSVRARRMTEQMRRRGWTVDVLTARALYQRTLDPEMCRGLEGVSVHRTHAVDPRAWAARRAERRARPPAVAAPTPPAAASGPPARSSRAASLARWLALRVEIPDARIGWAPVALAVGAGLPRPDVVLATIPVATSALVATALAARFGAGLVLDYRDPWNDDAPPSDWPAWRARLEARLEAWCLRRASATVATTPGIAASLRARGARDVHVVPNCCEPERFADVEPRRFERATLVYAGGLYGDRTLEPVLTALARLHETGRLGPERLGIHYLGRTPDAAQRAAAEAGASEFLTVEGVRPTREALAATLGASANLAIVGDSHARQVPAKLFEHMAAGRRMLVIAPDPSDARDIVSRVPSARCVTPDDGPGLEAALLEIANAGAAGAPAEIPAAFTLEETMGALDGILRGAARPRA